MVAGATVAEPQEHVDRGAGGVLMGTHHREVSLGGDHDACARRFRMSTAKLDRWKVLAGPDGTPLAEQRLKVDLPDPQGAFYLAVWAEAWRLLVERKRVAHSLKPVKVSVKTGQPLKGHVDDRHRGDAGHLVEGDPGELAGAAEVVHCAPETARSPT